MRHLIVITLLGFIVINSFGQIDRKYFDFSSSKENPDFKCFEWDSKNRSGGGLLKNGCALTMNSWFNSDEFGLKAVFTTLSSKTDIFSSQLSDEQIARDLNLEIEPLIKIIFKDDDLFSSYRRQIESKKYLFDKKRGVFSITISNKAFDEISISLNRFSYYSYTVFVMMRGLRKD